MMKIKIPFFMFVCWLDRRDSRKQTFHVPVCLVACLFVCLYYFYDQFYLILLYKCCRRSLIMNLMYVKVETMQWNKMKLKAIEGKVCYRSFDGSSTTISIFLFLTSNTNQMVSHSWQWSMAMINGKHNPMMRNINDFFLYLNLDCPAFQIYMNNERENTVYFPSIHLSLNLSFFGSYSNNIYHPKMS